MEARGWGLRVLARGFSEALPSRSFPVRHVRHAGPYSFFPNNTWCFIFDFQRHSLALSGQVRRCCTASCFHFANVPPTPQQPTPSWAPHGAASGFEHAMLEPEKVPAELLRPAGGAVGAPPKKASGPCGSLRLPALHVLIEPELSFLGCELLLLLRFVSLGVALAFCRGWVSSPSATLFFETLVGKLSHSC